jgi:hypothetical protein
MRVRTFFLACLVGATMFGLAATTVIVVQQ